LNEVSDFNEFNWTEWAYNELIEWNEWNTWTERIAWIEWIELSEWTEWSESDWDPLGELNNLNQNELNEVCNRDVYGTMVLRFRPTIRIVPQIYSQKHNGILTNQWERGWRHGLTNHEELAYWIFIDST